MIIVMSSFLWFTFVLQCNVDFTKEDVQESYIGCFQDSFERRLLDKKINLKETNTPQTCNRYCAELGYAYAGVQWGLECHCGNKFPSNDLKIEEWKCDQSCSGESSQICGGYLKMNLYNSHFHQKKIGYIPQESEYHVIL